MNLFFQRISWFDVAPTESEMGKNTGNPGVRTQINQHYLKPEMLKYRELIVGVGIITKIWSIGRAY